MTPPNEDAVAPGPETADEGAEALELYFALALTRAADERLRQLEGEGRIPLAPRRLPLREIGALGAAFAVRPREGRPRDMLAPTRRAAGALRLFGVSLTHFFRDHIEGRVGSIHGHTAELQHVDLDAGVLAPVAPLGVLVEVMAGISLSFRLRGEDRVGVVFDDGSATSTGSWHEGVAFAAARRCPLVLVVEAAAIDSERPRSRDPHTRVASFTEKGPGYGAEADSVDGTDVLAVLRTIRAAVHRARQGGGVQLVEIRYPDESSEPADPAQHLRTTLIERGIATAPELDELDREATRAAADAAGRAAEEAAPAAEEAAPDEPPIYAGHDPTRPRRTWASPQVNA